MTYRVVPRTEIGLPAVVRSTTGARRPRIHNCRWLTFHYTGVSSRGFRTADVAREVVRIQEIFSKTKPFQYNYVIGQNGDDLIYEFAGKFAAAHSAGENSEAVGVLFLNAVDEPLTATQIRKAQWLRDVLIWEGSLRPTPDQWPHRCMPGAATQCPGELIMAQLPELVKPFVQAPGLNPVDKLKEDVMVAVVIRPPADHGLSYTAPWLVQINGSTTYIGTSALEQLVAAGTPVVVHNKEQYHNYRKAAGL